MHLERDRAMKSIIKSLYQYSMNKEIKELIFKSFNKDSYVRSFAAYSQNTPISVLEKLSEDEDYSIRKIIAFKSKYSGSCFRKIK